MLTADDVVRLLDLKPHPIEGGYFRETWRGQDVVRDRSVGTAIYYLLSARSVSEMHRLPGDEVFNFYRNSDNRCNHLPALQTAVLTSLCTSPVTSQPPY